MNDPEKVSNLHVGEKFTPDDKRGGLIATIGVCVLLLCLPYHSIVFCTILLLCIVSNYINLSLSTTLFHLTLLNMVCAILFNFKKLFFSFFQIIKKWNTYVTSVSTPVLADQKSVFTCGLNI